MLVGCVLYACGKAKCCVAKDKMVKPNRQSTESWKRKRERQLQLSYLTFSLNIHFSEISIKVVVTQPCRLVFWCTEIYILVITRNFLTLIAALINGQKIGDIESGHSIKITENPWAQVYIEERFEILVRSASECVFYIRKVEKLFAFYFMTKNY